MVRYMLKRPVDNVSKKQNGEKNGNANKLFFVFRHKIYLKTYLFVLKSPYFIRCVYTGILYRFEH